MPTLEAFDPDAAWRAAALLHTLVRPEPLPHRTSLFAAFVAAQYMDRSGEGIDPPYGALPDLVRKVRDTRVSVYAVAEALRSWRIRSRRARGRTGAVHAARQGFSPPNLAAARARAGSVGTGYRDPGGSGRQRA
jgi:hypothetical protein